MPARRHAPRDEVVYKNKYVGTVEYHTSRSGYGDASMVSYRFPCQVPQKTSPDFVLIHGIGVSARSYGPTAVELANHGDVHLIDLAGYGRSPRPQPRPEHRGSRRARRQVPAGREGSRPPNGRVWRRGPPKSLGATRSPLRMKTCRHPGSHGKSSHRSAGAPTDPTAHDHCPATRYP
ncbi:alpha/beta fold hydrolase [Tessaracoccus sp. Z1128]